MGVVMSTLCRFCWSFLLVVWIAAPGAAQLIDPPPLSPRPPAEQEGQADGAHRSHAQAPQLPHCRKALAYLSESASAIGLPPGMDEAEIRRPQPAAQLKIGI